MRYRSAFTVALLLCYSLTVTAQVNSVEFYAGAGVFSANPDAQTSTFSTMVTTTFGESFRVVRPANFIEERLSVLEDTYTFRFGADVHFDLSPKTSLYTGLYVNASRFSISERITSDFNFTGPADTILIDPTPPGSGLGTPFTFCPGAFSSNSSNQPRGIMIDVGLPVGVRTKLLNDRLALRAQVSVATPVVSRFERPSSTFQPTPAGCLDRIDERVSFRDNYSIAPLVLRAGAGVDLRLLRAFTVGVTVDQQLTDSFREGPEPEALSLRSTPLRGFRPLSVRLVGRYRL